MFSKNAHSHPVAIHTLVFCAGMLKFVKKSARVPRKWDKNPLHFLLGHSWFIVEERLKRLKDVSYMKRFYIDLDFVIFFAVFPVSRACRCIVKSDFWHLPLVANPLENRGAVGV